MASISSLFAGDFHEIHDAVEKKITTLQEMQRVTSLYSLYKKNQDTMGIEWYLHFLPYTPEEKELFIGDQARVVYDAFLYWEEIRNKQDALHDSDLTAEIRKLGQSIRITYSNLDEYGKFRFALYFKGKNKELELFHFKPVMDLDLEYIVLAYKNFVKKAGQEFFSAIEIVYNRL
jgi:hypothetical protein